MSEECKSGYISKVVRVVGPVVYTQKRLLVLQKMQKNKPHLRKAMEAKFVQSRKKSDQHCLGPLLHENELRLQVG